MASPITITGKSHVMVLDQFDSSSIVALSLATGDVQWTAPRAETSTWAAPVLYETAGGSTQIVTVQQ